MELAPDFRNDWEEWSKQYPLLTKEQLLEELRKDTELLKGLQEKTGKTKEEIFDWLHLMG